jgi:hypothetical protein
MEEFPSGQREQTVNLSLFSFGGSNPPSSTNKKPITFVIGFLFYFSFLMHLIAANYTAKQ